MNWHPHLHVLALLLKERMISPELVERIRNELKASGRMDELGILTEKARNETVTLLFGARDREKNNAVVLREILEELS